MTDYTIPAPDHVDGAPTFTPGAIGDLARQFHDARLAADSMREADAEFMRPVTDEWAQVLAGERAALSTDATARFLAAARETLALRDALLCAALGGLDADATLRMAADPHGAAQVRKTYDILGGVFNDPDRFPDFTAHAFAAQAMTQMAIMAPGGRDMAHPLAMLSYLAWSEGCQEPADAWWQAALHQDPGCSLANIMAHASAYGVRPAWAEAHPDGVSGPAEPIPIPGTDAPEPGIGI